MRKKYIVRLTSVERQDLLALVKRGKGTRTKLKRAEILLAADADGPGWPDARIAQAYHCHRTTVETVRRRFVLEGMEVAVERKTQERPSRERKLDGKGEARLICLACSKPPRGRSCWSLQLLADELVRLKVVDSISGQTVRRTLKKTNFSLIGRSAG
ncbi:MAG: helix-turn-helix domain-containing protein [Planctomycetota bacterium]|jgi:hypothetical protein